MHFNAPVRELRLHQIAVMRLLSGRHFQEAQQKWKIVRHSRPEAGLEAGFVSGYRHGDVFPTLSPSLPALSPSLTS